MSSAWKRAIPLTADRRIAPIARGGTQTLLRGRHPGHFASVSVVLLQQIPLGHLRKINTEPFSQRDRPAISRRSVVAQRQWRLFGDLGEYRPRHCPTGGILGGAGRYEKREFRQRDNNAPHNRPAPAPREAVRIKSASDTFGSRFKRGHRHIRRPADRHRQNRHRHHRTPRYIRGRNSMRDRPQNAQYQSGDRFRCHGQAYIDAQIRQTYGTGVIPKRRNSVLP